MRKIISKIAQDTIAAVGGCGWVSCKCGRQYGLNASQITDYLGNGWPLCCGKTMMWLTPREAMNTKARAAENSHTKHETENA